MKNLNSIFKIIWDKLNVIVSKLSNVVTLNGEQTITGKKIFNPTNWTDNPVINNIMDEPADIHNYDWGLTSQPLRNQLWTNGYAVETFISSGSEFHLINDQNGVLDEGISINSIELDTKPQWTSDLERRSQIFLNAKDILINEKQDGLINIEDEWIGYTPTQDNSVVNKKYVDDNISDINSNVVTLTGDQIITGIKTFDEEGVIKFGENGFSISEQYGSFNIINKNSQGEGFYFGNYGYPNWINNPEGDWNKGYNIYAYSFKDISIVGEDGVTIDGGKQNATLSGCWIDINANSFSNINVPEGKTINTINIGSNNNNSTINIGNGNNTINILSIANCPKSPSSATHLTNKSYVDNSDQTLQTNINNEQLARENALLLKEDTINKVNEIVADSTLTKYNTAHSIYNKFSAVNINLQNLADAIPEISQSTGNSEEKVMSQKAVTDALSSSGLFNYVGAVADATELPIEDNNNFDTYLLEDTNKLVFWLNEEWIPINESIDLTDYATNSEVETAIADITGKLSNLVTTDKTSLVGAINENKGRIDGNVSSISGLTTSISIVENDVLTLQNNVANIKQFITYQATNETTGLAYSALNPGVFVWWEE